MKVYVDELPKSCGKCPCIDFGHCNLTEKNIVDEIFDDKRPKNCPLQSLTEHDKQIRKEVVQEIREIAGDYWTIPLGKFVDVCGEEISACLAGDDFDEILDQIEGRENGKIDNK